MDLRPLTAEETAALQAFANAHGVRWKVQLTEVYWPNARVWHGPVEGMGNVLHAMRNDPRIGPSYIWGPCTIQPARAPRKPRKVKP